jgi:hypothetical protein
MQHLRAGDKVLTSSADGTLAYEDVYFFGHANPTAVADFVELKLEHSSRPLQISSRHFVPLCPVAGQPCKYGEHVYKYAHQAVAGDHLWVVGGNRDTVELARVKEIGVARAAGMFNPYTLGGSIVVNNVLASSHSDWILDDLVPLSLTGYLPYIYQALFAPGRLLYALFGSSAADALDLNSPMQHVHGHGAEFLVGALLLPCTLLALFIKLKK